MSSKPNSVELVEASRIRRRDFIRVHNEEVCVTSVSREADQVLIRYLNTWGNASIQVSATSKVPRYPGKA